MPIQIKSNPRWNEKNTYQTNKYSPVIVDRTSNLKETTDVKAARKQACLEMMDKRDFGYGWPDVKTTWSFSDPDHDMDGPYNFSTVPLFVTSSDSAAKIAQYLSDDAKLPLAWDIRSYKKKPIYLFVHKAEFDTYKQHLGHLCGRGKDYELVGWSGGALTGFGAARSAVLRLAEELYYKPERIIMMDHDVLDKDENRSSEIEVKRKIEEKHDNPGGAERGVVGLGKASPNRVSALTTAKGKFNPGQSPTQQYVSIRAPFIPKKNKLYALYMVAGGEDVAMGLKHEHVDLSKKHPKNSALMKSNIDKIDLGSVQDGNVEINNLKKTTISKLYNQEKDIKVVFDGANSTIGEASDRIKARLLEKTGVSLDVEYVSSLIIERILLSRYKHKKADRKNAR